VTFRRRLVLLAAVAVAAAVLLGSGVTYAIVRHDLRARVDRGLEDLTADVLERTNDAAARETRPARDVRRATKAPATEGRGRVKLPPVKPVLPPPGRLGESTGYAQFISSDGRAVKPFEGDPRGHPIDVGVTSGDLSVARGTRLTQFSDREVAGVHARVLTTALEDGGAVQAVRSLEGVDSTLARLALVLTVVGAGGIGLAGALGWLVAHGAVKPVAQLTAAAERVTTTRDLSERIEFGGDDDAADLQVLDRPLPNLPPARRPRPDPAPPDPPRRVSRPNKALSTRPDVTPFSRQRPGPPAAAPEE
jgi:two-component system, OmpR family, sensor histidine kinase MprB